MVSQVSHCPELRANARGIVAIHNAVPGLLDALDAAEKESAAWKRELDLVREVARKDNLRAEDADRYEQWLLDLGRISGCGHVDERLPVCIEQAFSNLAAKLAAAEAERDHAKAELAEGLELNNEMKRLFDEACDQRDQAEAALATPEVYAGVVTEAVECDRDAAWAKARELEARDALPQNGVPE